MCKENVLKEGHGLKRIPPFLTVKNFPLYFDWPNEGGLRYYIFNSQVNGLHVALLKVGRRVLIDTDAFVDWVRNQGKGEPQ